MFFSFRKMRARKNPKPGNDEQQKQDVAYAIEVERTLQLLEARLHETDNPEEIIQGVMKTACQFYQGDWVGFLEVDLELNLWTPYVWYNGEGEDQTTTLLKEFEPADYFKRWIVAMERNNPVCIETPDKLPDAVQEEMDLYKHLSIKTLLAVPVKPRPMGFLVVRNPQRYITRSSLLQFLAFALLSSINEQKLMESLKMSLAPESIQSERDVIINL